MNRLLLYALETVAIAGLVSAVGLPAYGDSEDDLRLEIHAFLSQGYLKTTNNNYLAQSKVGSFDFTEAGINFTKTLSENQRIGAQLFAHRLGPAGNFQAKVDWIYFDYHWSDLIGFRFGRVKLPFGLYNDSSDIDSARVPVLLPQSIYPVESRDFLLAQTGVELYGYTGPSSAGALDYRLYAGTIFLDVGYNASSPAQLTSLSIPYVVGSRLMWETPLHGLRVGGTVQALRLDMSFVLSPGSVPISGDVPAVLYVASSEYLYQELSLAAEYSRWNVRSENGSNPALFPDTNTTSERAYAMAAYRVNSCFQPGAYYSLTHPNVDRRAGPQDYSHDWAATVRFDLNPHWLLKVEGHYVQGTAALSAPLNAGVPPAALEEKWGALLIKTTAYF